MKIVVSRKELMASLLFASEDDSRYTLNGVCIQVRPKRTPIMVSTDGRRLAVIETLADQSQDFDEPHEMVLSSSFIRPICALSRTVGGKLFPWIEFENVKGSARVGVAFVGAGLFAVAESRVLIEGAYPKWEKCLPPRSKSARTPITDIGLNVDFMGDFAKAAKLLDAKSPVIQMNLVGKEQAVEVKILGASHFYGMIMQCKCDDSVEYQPEFVSIVKDLPKPPEPEETEEDEE